MYLSSRKGNRKMKEPFFYEQGFINNINDSTNPLYYFFDYDVRSHNYNMDFQHFHQFFEIFILLGDKANHVIEGEHFTLQQYDILLINPMVLHQSQYLDNAPCKRLIIDFQFPLPESTQLRESVQQLLSLFKNEFPIFRFNEDTQADIFSPINEIFTLLKEKDEQWQLMVHTKFTEFLYLLHKHQKENLYAFEQDNDSMERKIYETTSYIHANFQQELSLQFLADKAHVNSYYLSHQFKKITGFTLVNYIQMTRVRNAQQLLLYSNLKISDVAERCGFNSFSQFNRVFRKLCFTSPSELRSTGEINDTVAKMIYDKF